MWDLTNAVVVGFDGSAAALLAVDWAAAEAKRRGNRLEVVYAVDAQTRLVGVDTASTWLETHGDAIVQRVVTEGVRRAQVTCSQVSGLSRVGTPAGVLTDASRTAELVVVGASGLGRITESLIGSVAYAVATHAACPVVVVRGEGARPLGPQAPVVVAVDGSPEADLAVDWAASVAAATGAELHLVTGWQVHPAEAWVSEYWASVEAYEGPAEAARTQAQLVLDAARERVARTYPALPVHAGAVEGVTREVLTEASTTAGLLVVGSRGRGAFAGLLLGSTSRAMIRLAACPVAVVRSVRRPETVGHVGP